jgi:hypothetical protein
MAIMRFTGATNGDLSEHENYQEFSGGAWIATATIPASGDTIYFTNSDRNITAGLNQSAIDPAAVIFASDYTGRAGSGAGSIQYGTITSLQINTGGPWVFLNATVTNANINLSGGKQLYITGGTWTNVRSGSGVIVAGTARIDNLYNDSAIWSFGTNANDLLIVENGKGQINVADRDIRSYGGAARSRLTTSGTAKISDGSGGGQCRLADGATWVANSYGTHDTTLVHAGAMVDPSGSEYVQTFTNLYQWAGGRFNDSSPGIQPVVTNRFYVSGGGGSVSSFSVGTPLGGI